MICPDDSELAAFVDGALEVTARAVIETHLDGCDRCRGTIGHVAATATDAPHPSVRYRLDRIIGSGGMGVVWQAWDPTLERGLAIKLLRAEITDEHGRARLIREARALARLQHPNVIAIYDVGELDGELFIATELIDGESMDRWQRGKSAAEVIAAYVQAARGLAAAHSIGLVHRDVKPSNILVGRDGRVRIGDFGLATRDLGTAPTAPSTGPRDGDGQLTRTGELVGTPAYMAPEQHAGAAVDARADQYSLCLALAEALLGVRPEPATTAETLESTGSKRMSVAARQTYAVPWRALARGLAARPEERYPDLAPLIAELEGKPDRTRRKLALAAVSAAAVAVAATALALRTDERDPIAACADRRPMAGIWGPANRDALQTAFLAKQLPYGADAARTTIAALDGLASELDAEDRRACEDHAAGRQSAELAVRRQTCLTRLAGQIGAFADVLAAEPDAQAIQRASAGARAMPDPRLCNSAAGLADQVIAPDPVVAARASAVSARVTKALTLRLAFRLKEARALAESALSEARTLGFLPAIAEAQHELGLILNVQGAAEAERTLVEALATAAEAHLDYRGARIAAVLVSVVGGRGDVEAAERQARLARTAIIRAGNDRQLDAGVERGLGRAYMAATKYEAARDHYKRAEDIDSSLGLTHYVDLDRTGEATALANLDRVAEASRITEQLLASEQRLLGPKHPHTISDLKAQGLLLIRAGRYQDAAPILERALALTDEVSGRDTDQAASLRSAVAIAYIPVGRLEEAAALLHEAVRVFATHMSPDDVELRGQRENLAIVHTRLGRYADAEVELAQLAQAARQAKDDESLGEVLQNYAECLIKTGKAPQALVAAKEALDLYGKVFGMVSRRVGEVRTTLGNVYVALGKRESAAAEYAAAIDAFERTVGKDTAQLGDPLIGLGELQLARKDAASARPLLERAVALLVNNDPVDVARARFALAEALDAGGERARATAEARGALELVRNAGSRAEPLARRIERWLVAHR